MRESKDQGRYLVGVDGGNSKTLAVIADSTGTILGIGRTGSGNHQGPGLECAMHNIRVAIDIALSESGIRVDEVAHAYFTLAGADLPEDFVLLRSALLEVGVGDGVGLDNDTMGALHSGTDKPNAVVVVMGAGTNGAGINEAGQSIRLPGLGWYSGDWGGGGDLARKAIWNVARAWDGRGEPTLLTDMILQLFEVPDVEALIRHFYFSHDQDRTDQRRARFLHIAPLVFTAAGFGDTVAIRIVERLAQEVVTTAVALLRRLDITSVDADVVLGGSIFRTTEPLLLQIVRCRLQKLAPAARTVLPDLEPVVGALFCAMKDAGIPVDRVVRQTAAQSYQVVQSRHARITST